MTILIWVADECGDRVGKQWLDCALILKMAAHYNTVGLDKFGDPFAPPVDHDDSSYHEVLQDSKKKINNRFHKNVSIDKRVAKQN